MILLSLVSSVNEGVGFSPANFYTAVSEQGPNLGLPLQYRHQDDAEGVALMLAATRFPKRRIKDQKRNKIYVICIKLKV